MYFITPPLFLKKIYSKAIWSLPGKEKKIYLTFDDGPTPEVTPWVLDTLKRADAKATFFCVGANVEKHSGLFQRVISEKHSIGNHTFNHLNGWKVKNSEYIENIKQCDRLINSYLPPVTDYRLPLFRPPYGRIRPSQFSILNSQFSIIMWDVLSGDFDEKVSREECLENVLKNTRAGSIVVFHDSVKAKENLYYTLPKFLCHFSEQGFSFNSLGTP